MIINLITVSLILILAGIVIYQYFVRKKADDSLSPDYISYLDVFDAIPDIMGIQDTDRRILRYNAAGYRYLNLTPSDAIGRHCYELIGRNFPCEICATHDAVSSGAVASVVKYIPETDTWFNVRAYPIKDDDGRVVKVVEHLRDISEEKRLQSELKKLNRNLEQQVEDRTKDLSDTINELTTTRDQLIESEKLSALGRMVAGLSHEVNTPLGVAVTSASFIRNLIDDLRMADSVNLADENISGFLDQLDGACNLINDNLKRAGKLMGGFKRIAADQTSEQLRTIHPAEYLLDLENSLHHVLKKTSHSTSHQYESIRMITTYPGAVSQVFSNLYMNSLKHAFPDNQTGNITLTYRDSAGGVEIIFADDGCGMDKETLKHLYDPFFSARMSSDGIGLGMNIVYNLVLGKLKGSIACQSSPGAGTQYTITLPDLSGDIE